MVARVDRLLTHTVAVAGLTALVVAVYVVVILTLGRTPSDDERSLLLASMVAAGLAALLYLPARHWLTERANRLVYGERVAPDETLRTFGQRLTRSIPMDELLLQLVESLRKSHGAGVRGGVDGAGRALRARRRRPPSPATADHDRRQGAPGRRPRRRQRRDMARRVAAATRRPCRLGIDAGGADRPRR